MEEIWKDIVGYERLYQISNYGEIKSLYNYRGKGNILKQRMKKGYYTIGLRKNGTRKWYSVHILVANAFLDRNNYKSMPSENRNLININKLDVNHKDENKLNNRYDNLEFCTRLYNNCYGSRLEKVSDSNKLKKESETV